MASPIGHSLLALALGRGLGMGSGVPSKSWLLLTTVSANAADLDFVPGLLMGDANLFHRGLSHSFSAALVFGLLVRIVSFPVSAKPWRIGLAAAALYSSHLVLDFFTSDSRVPLGSPLLWPFTSNHFISPWTVFGGIKHGVPGETVWEVIKQVVSLSNAAAIGIETLALLPVVVLTWMLFKNAGRVAKPGIWAR